MDKKQQALIKYIGFQFKNFLTKQKLTNTEAAKLAGISRNQVAWICTGTRKVTFETLVKLAVAIGLDLDFNIERAINNY